jgi:hypothetical protein
LRQANHYFVITTLLEVQGYDWENRKKGGIIKSKYTKWFLSKTGQVD